MDGLKYTIIEVDEERKTLETEIETLGPKTGYLNLESFRRKFSPKPWSSSRVPLSEERRY
jgi:hypothetical protein